MGKNIMYIFRPYITKKGKRIYPKRAKVFKIPIKRGRLALKEKKTTTSTNRCKKMQVLGPPT